MGVAYWVAWAFVCLLQNVLLFMMGSDSYEEESAGRDYKSGRRVLIWWVPLQSFAFVLLILCIISAIYEACGGSF